MYTTIALPSGDAPGGIAANSATNRVYVVDGGSTSSSGAVWVIDAATNSVINTISTSVNGFKSIAVNSRSNKVYVANQGAGSVTVINGANDAIVKTVTVPGCPTGIDVNPFTNRVYVSSRCTGDNLYVIDGASDTLLSVAIPLGGVAGPVAVDPINNRVYVRLGSVPLATIVIDGTTNGIVKTITAVGAMSIDPYTPSVWGIPASGAGGLALSLSDDSSVVVESDLNILGAVVDTGTKRAYGISVGTTSTLVIAARGQVIAELKELTPVAAVARPLTLIPEKRLFILNANRTVSVVPLAFDVLSLGNVTATNATVSVPIYLRDAPATPLGIDSTARFSSPGGLASDRKGGVVVADIFNQTLRNIAGSTVTTIAGSPANLSDGDGGPATSAHLLFPYGVATNAAGDIYIADYLAGRVRKILVQSGAILTVAGTGERGFSGDGGLAVNATLSLPTRVAVDSSGNLFICDSGNNRVRRVDATTGVITTVAGNGLQTASGDGGPATAAGVSPFAVAVDADGNLYIADDANHIVRKVSTSGTISTLAGSAGQIGSTDGSGSDARFFLPKGISVDDSGAVYIADFANHNIRKITAAGVVTTVAGGVGVSGSADGTGTAARFNSPIDIAATGNGELYVSDYLNSTIRKISANGVVTTVAGVAGRTGTADGGQLPRIQGYGLTVHFSDKTKISGCSNANFPNCQVTFETSGIASHADVTSLAKGSEKIVIGVSYVSSASLPFTGESAEPGDQVGTLTFVLSSSAAGSQIGLSLVDSPDAVNGLQPPAANGLSSGGIPITESLPDITYQSGSITVPANTCLAAPTDSNLVLAYVGLSSGCRVDSSAGCSPGETIAFDVTTLGYTFQTCDSVLWSFGDNSFSSNKSTFHTYTTNGTYPVSVKVTNPVGSITLKATITVSAGATNVCTLSLSKPVGGETWTKGTGQDITWSRGAACGTTMTIELLKSGALYDVITTAAIAANNLFTHTPPTTYADGTDYTIRIRDNSSGVSATSSASFTIVSAQVPQDTSSLTIVSGTLNGQSFSAANPVITVAPGTKITGAFFVSINSTFPSNAVMSIGVTSSWGVNSTGYTDLGHFSTPVSNLVMSVPVSYTAPLTTSTNYIVTAFNGEFNAGQVLSCTNWSHGDGTPVWRDGNDVADWSAAQMSSALTTGRALGSVLYSDGYKPQNIPAAVVIVKVEQPCTITLTSPLTGATWTNGSAQQITWTTSGNCSSSLSVQLYKAGSFLTELGTATTLSGSFSTVPSSSLLSGSDYQIRLRDLPTGTTATSGIFSILGASSGSCGTINCSASVPSSTAVDASTSFVAQVPNPNCSQLSYTWVFGDGASVTGSFSSVTHVYSVAGSYTWSLFVQSPSDLCFRSGQIEVTSSSRRRGARH